MNEEFKRPFGPRVSVEFKDRSREAKQSFKDQCDVNQIVSVFQKTGQLINQRVNQSPMFGDFTQTGDFRVLQHARLASTSYYNSLPENVRKQFTQDEFYRFASDDKNRDKLIELGVVKGPEPAPPEKVLKVEVITKGEPKAKPADGAPE